MLNQSINQPAFVAKLARASDIFYPHPTLWAVQCVINDTTHSIPDADADNAAGFLGYLYIGSTQWG